MKNYYLLLLDVLHKKQEIPYNLYLFIISF